MENFADRLHAEIGSKDSRVCVGLDPRIDGLPPRLRDAASGGPAEAARAFVEFCAGIIQAVSGYAVAVKPQAAFFEALGPPGYQAMWDVIAEARAASTLVILDAKRSDIGSTAEAYAQAYLDPPEGLQAPDALTINAYLGSDGVIPFVNVAARTGRGLFVLAKTSNPSSGELQDLDVGGTAIFRLMTDLIADWGRDLLGDCGYSSVGAVAGATFPEQLAQIRAEAPTVPFLVPGYGAQGAGAEEVTGAFDSQGDGAVVNSSRGIIFAWRDAAYRDRFGPDDYAAAAAAAACDMRDDINHALDSR